MYALVLCTASSGLVCLCNCMIEIYHVANAPTLAGVRVCAGV
jgi:hypothetical protein